MKYHHSIHRSDSVSGFKQGEKFRKKSVFTLLRMPLDDVIAYHLKLRAYEFEHRIPLSVLGLKLRKLIHPLLIFLLQLDRHAAGEKLYVIRDDRQASQKPQIFTCTHIGGNDVQRIFESMRTHAYLFIGDLKGIYQDLTGLLLYGNGAICCETNCKSDRRIAYNRALELLQKGGNLLIFPEGAWNITPNLPVMNLYPGAIRMAAETGAEIVPIAIAQYDNRFYVAIGKNYTPNVTSDLAPAIDDLRDRMASLKWETFEQNGLCCRESIPECFLEAYQQAIIEKCPYEFTLEDVEKAICRRTYQ